MTQPELKQVIDGTTLGSGWKGLYTLGGATGLIAVGLPLAEILIDFLPGVAHMSARTVTALDWFALFQGNWLLGLRNLGVLNIVGAALLAPTFLGIGSVLRRDSEAWAVFGTILFFVGMAVFLAGNRAFSMLSLSFQYAGATSDAQRSLLAAAGQAMLVEGQSRAGIPLMEFAGLVISAVMLRGRIFSKATGYAGLFGNSLLMGVESILAVLRRLPDAGMVIAVGGGVFIMIWYLLVGRKLLQLGRL